MCPVKKGKKNPKTKSVRVPERSRKHPRQTRASTKKYTMTYVISSNYHFTEGCSADGRRASTTGSTQIEEIFEDTSRNRCLNLR